MGRFQWENDRLIETQKGGEGNPIFSKMKFKAAFGISLFWMGLFLVVGSGCRRQGGEVSSEAVEGQVTRLRELDFTPFDGALGRLSSEGVRRVTKLIEGSTVLQVQAALQAKEVTAEELTLVMLDRIRRYDGRLRSYIELNPGCLEEARASDRERAEGRWRGPLHGIPLSLKDNIGTVAPMHTTAGAEILLDHSPAKDAVLVTKLKAAGAVVLGKAAMSELAGVLTTEPAGYNAVSGIGVNPYGEGFPVFGSSSGSAIATSAGLAMVSVGTETSGSLIAPASMNGVVGMKPSLGVVSGEGVVPLIRVQDSAGPVGRWVSDAAVLLGAMDEGEEDYVEGLKADALEGVVVGVLRAGIKAKGEGGEEGEWLRRIDEGLSRAKAVSRDVGESFEGKPGLFPVICLGLSVDTLGYIAGTGAEVRTVGELKAYNEARRETRAPRGQNILEAATQVLAAIEKQTGAAEGDLKGVYEEAAMEVRGEARALLDKAFAESGAEVLVSLSNVHSTLYATAGYPAITVPLGLDRGGAPNGVTFIGKAGADAKLLAYAFAFEQATLHRSVPESVCE
jgi:amidase